MTESTTPASLVALMSTALAIELEAADRYGELADVMETHNNPEVAALFRRMQSIEGMHADAIRALLVENFVSQMTVFWRRRVHERIGYLDASMRYSFDYEFWLRLAGLGDPLYVPERQAAFRWYRTSKSGSSFGRQFQEDLAAFRRHAPPDPLLRLRKRLKTAQILGAYWLLRLAGGG